MSIRSIIGVVILCVVFVGSASAGTLDENKGLVEGFVQAGNTRDYDRLADYVATDFVRHCQATPGLVVTNLEQFKSFLKADVVVCPDSQVDVQMMVAEGDLVAIWATYSGTQEGAMGPFPPSGKKIVLDFGAVFRVENEKLTELWVTWDNLTALSQLGHYPPKTGE
jgi:steroid delta-isomerase-like uncharacterized protein